MAKILSFHEHSLNRYYEEDRCDYLALLLKAEVRLTGKLADLMLESKYHPDIDKTLQMLAFVRKEFDDLNV